MITTVSLVKLFRKMGAHLEELTIINEKSLVKEKDNSQHISILLILDDILKLLGISKLYFNLQIQMKSQRDILNIFIILFILKFIGGDIGE